MSLTNVKIRKVVIELSQVAVAVQTMGRTTRKKLGQMADLADGLARELHGLRSEIVNARFGLESAIRAVRSASIKGNSPGQKLRELAKAVDDLKRLVARNLVDAEAAFRIDGFDIRNAWGYSKFEVRDGARALEGAAKELRRVGLGKLVRGRVELDPGQNPRAFVLYEPISDALILNLSRSGTHNVRDVLRALAGRLWVDLDQGGYETWGGPANSQRFETAFASALVGKVDPDTAARLETTVGRQASRWPELT